jgi:7-cyano-7-deazaguanine synthase
VTDKAVVVMSGGLDSTTLLHHVINLNYTPYALSFDYGQRHKKELLYAQRTCDENDVDWYFMDLRNIGGLFATVGSQSTLINTDNAVPEGHYGEASMKQTIVPNRNMIMSSISVGYAISLEAKEVALGVHAGDHFIYPDCRQEFFTALHQAIKIGNEGFNPPHLWTPFIDWSKNNIAARAFELGVDIANTWSCYKGGDIHCGRCGTCVERQEAIASTGFEDPTEYEDNTFWKEAIKRETV